MKTFSNTKGTPIRVQVHLFDCMIKPIALYGSQIWGAHLNTWYRQDYKHHTFQSNDSAFEELHTTFCKRVLGVQNKTSSFGAKCELGRYPRALMLNVMQYTCNTKFVTNVISKPRQSLSCKALLCQANSQDNKSFLFIVWKIMGWGGVKNIPGSAKTNSSIAKMIKSKLIDWYKHHVFKRIKLKSTSSAINCKLRTYFKIKRTFSFEKYLESNNSKLRQNVAKLRLSNHNLPIERGRYKNIELKM